jgi:hypothetical protein
VSATTEIIGAAGGIVGAVTGVVGLRYGVTQHRELKGEREAADRRLESAQAEKVFGWAERRTEKEGREVCAWNGSENFVRDVKVWLVTSQPPLPARDRPPDRRPVVERAILKPGETTSGWISPEGMVHPAPEKRPPVAMTFVDAEGRGWFRSITGAVAPYDR